MYIYSSYNDSLNHYIFTYVQIFCIFIYLKILRGKFNGLKGFVC